MKSLLLLFVVLFVFTDQLSGQSYPDYRSKTLIRALRKADLGEPDNLKEIRMNKINSEIHSNGKFFMIENPDNKTGYLYIGRVFTCHAGGCSIANTDRTGKESASTEYFDYFIIYNKLKELVMVKVYNYQATHGYEISSRGWLKQFSGYNGSNEMRVNKNIDAISGATISVHAITEDIIRITELINSISVLKKNKGLSY
ncbi:MAG: FMN-binding protein [Bacteroidales bacterium]|nr:FMN-binding protein [Bacteroidales bacterium]